MSPENQAKNAKTRAAIEAVNAAATAFDAERASGTARGSLLYRNGSEAITALWEKYGDECGPPDEPWPQEALDQFKAALVSRLEKLLIPEPQWESSDKASLQFLAKEVEHYALSDREALAAMPAAVLDRAWQALADDPNDVFASTILTVYHRERFREGPSDHAGEIMRLINLQAAARAESLFDACHALWNVIRNTQHAKSRKIPTPTDPAMQANPMHALEVAYGGVDIAKNDRMLVGCSMGAYRGMILATTKFQREMLPGAVALALREAYHFQLADSPRLVDSTLAWIDSVAPRLEAALPSELREMWGTLYKGLAHNVQEPLAKKLTLLEKARSLLREGGEEHADCLFQIGHALESKGDIREAMRQYEACMASPGCVDPVLRGVVHFAYWMMRAENEGNFTLLKIEPASLEALGYDPKLSERFVRAIEAMTQDKLPETDAKEFMQSLATLIEKWERERYKPSAIFSQYLLLLKVALSMHPRVAVPYDCKSVAERARTYLAHAEPHQMEDFSILEEHLATMS